MRVFENRVLRRIFGPKMDDVTREWEKLHNEELNELYSTQYYSGDKNQKSELGGTCSAYGGEERRIQGLVGKPLGRRPPGRPNRRWDDNIKMDLQEGECGGMDWIE